MKAIYLDEAIERFTQAVVIAYIKSKGREDLMDVVGQTEREG